MWRQYDAARREAADDLRARAVLAATVFDTYFAGQLAALSAIAASPAVVSGDREQMTEYFARLRPGRSTTFPAGVGWIDLEGRQRVTSDPGGPIGVSLADRSYFKQVIATKKPFVSEAIVARTTSRRLVVMSVATRDASGRLSGVLAAGLVLQPSGDDSRANELGYEGLEVIDRAGQRLSLRDLSRPSNRELVASVRQGEGVIVGTRGLDGSEDHVVAYAKSKVAGWTTVLDEPESTVFASARRSLEREAGLVAVALVLLLALLGWTFLRTRRDVREGRERVSRWSNFTRSLSDASDAAEIQRALAHTSASEYPTATVVVGFRKPDDATVEAIVEPGGRSTLTLTSEKAGKLAVLLLNSDDGAAEAERALPSVSSNPGRALSIHSLRLMDAGEAVGVAALLWAHERASDREAHTLFQAFVDQAAQALGRVRRHQQEHDVAALLQKSLLPSEAARGDGFVARARYRAGVAHTSVGGDWFDVVRRPDGIVHFSVGDVAGMGIEAAVTMGQLRNAFHAYALDYDSPAAILERMTRHVPVGGMATMAGVAYDPLACELRYAYAGHPPALLADGHTMVVTRLEGSRTGPLGWGVTAKVPDGRVELPTNATLVLYTDGLVERRDSALDDNIDRLADAVLDRLDDTPGQTVQEIVDLLADSPGDDDLALLLARLERAPAKMEIEIPADPALLRDIRRRLRAWLDARGMNESSREATVLAVSEACNNSIEHAYGGSGGTIVLSFEHADGRLEIRVSDEGVWRPPVENELRGRGRILMSGLMDEAEIVQTSQGTDVLLARAFES